MNKEKKLLLYGIICAILYLLLDFFVISKIDVSQFTNGQNIEVEVNPIFAIITYVLYFSAILYFGILVFVKKIDLNNHSKGILFWSIILFIFNIVSGIFGFIVYSRLDKVKKTKRELPVIEDKVFTNKYICLFSLIVSLLLMFVVSKYLSGFVGMLILYAAIFIIMILTFFKQLAHDFKIFKEYFKEYMSLVLKTWLKSLVTMMIIGIILQILTNTNQSNNQETLQKMFNVYPIFVAFLAMFYAPFAEELMFRGVIKKFFKGKYLFIIISGVSFGLLHVIDDSKTLAEFSYVLVYSALGMYLAGLYYKTNNLFSNISFHFLQNTLGVIAMIILYFIK